MPEEDCDVSTLGSSHSLKSVLPDGVNKDNLLVYDKGEVKIADRAKFITQICKEPMSLRKVKNHSRSAAVLKEAQSGFDFSFRGPAKYVSDKKNYIEDNKREVGSSTKTMQRVDKSSNRKSRSKR